MFLAISCTSESFISLFKIVASFVRIIYVMIPVILIIIGMIDFTKVIMSNKVESGEAFKIFMKRVISTVLVFIVVPIVIFILDVVNEGIPFSANVSNCNEVILKGLLNPSSIKTPVPAEEVEEEEEERQDVPL